MWMCQTREQNGQEEVEGKNDVAIAEEKLQ
jgi:hypothetical protein